MCGRYAASKDTATIVEEFEVEAVVDPAPERSYNVAPTDRVAFVVERPSREPAADDAEHVQRQLRQASWGLVPSWAKDPKIGARMINARWEEASQKPAFRRAFAARRCLIPADGYFEWYRPQHEGPGRPRKQPFFVHRADGLGLGLAGLYEFWRAGPDAPWLVTVTVLTTDAVGPLAALHDRMPVVIDPSGYAQWLDPTITRVDAPPLLAPELLVTYPVDQAVNSVRNNGPELVRPIPAEEVEAGLLPEGVADGEGGGDGQVGVGEGVGEGEGRR